MPMLRLQQGQALPGILLVDPRVGFHASTTRTQGHFWLRQGIKLVRLSLADGFRMTRITRKAGTKVEDVWSVMSTGLFYVGVAWLQYTPPVTHLAFHELQVMFVQTYVLNGTNVKRPGLAVEQQDDQQFFRTEHPCVRLLRQSTDSGLLVRLTESCLATCSVAQRAFNRMRHLFL